MSMDQSSSKHCKVSVIIEFAMLHVAKQQTVILYPLDKPYIYRVRAEVIHVYLRQANS